MTENFIGKKFNIKKYDKDEYAKVAAWCDETQLGYLKSLGDIIECIPMPEENPKEKAVQDIFASKEILSDQDYPTIRLMERILRVMDLTKYPELLAERDNLIPVWDAKENVRQKINNLQAAFKLAK